MESLSNVLKPSILPSYFQLGVKDRIDVEKSSDEQIETSMKVADTWKQEVILEDLILAAKNSPESPKIWLAVKLFIKAPEKTRDDFLFHLIQVRKCHELFFSVMRQSAAQHTLEKAPSYTSKELDLEWKLAYGGKREEALGKILTLLEAKE